MSHYPTCWGKLMLILLNDTSPSFYRLLSLRGSISLISCSTDGLWSWDSIISIVGRLWVGRSGFQIPVDVKDLSLLQNAVGSTQPHMQWVVELEWPGHEVQHSLPSHAKVKNA